MKYITLLFLSLATISSQFAFSQSSINENEPETVYVNGTLGNNNNSGSSSAPVATIQEGINKAIALAKSGEGTKVLISPGTYPEDITIYAYNYSSPITIQAATIGTVYVDGTNVLNNEKSINNGIYTYEWSSDVNNCSLPSGWPNIPSIGIDNNLLFINGISLTQVSSSSLLRPGTFYVNTSSDIVEVYPFPYTDMDVSQVRISTRQNTMRISDASNIVIRGLVFQHAASCINTGAIHIAGSKNIFLDDIQSNWNNWGGIDITGSNITIQNSIANHNGGLGIGIFDSTYLLLNNNETDYNNWRGAMANFYDYAQGGVKMGRVHNVTVTNHRAYNNIGEGLWFDTDNINIHVNNTTLIGNVVDNLKFEASQGPVTVTNSHMCSGGTGLLLINTAYATIKDNYFYNNSNTMGNMIKYQNAQIYLAGNSGGREVTNFQTNETTNVYTNYSDIENNSILAIGAQQYLFSTYLGESDWSEFTHNLYSSNNTWYNSTNPNDFGITGEKKVNFSSWQNTTDQDRDSTWKVPNIVSCSAPSTTYPDFQLLGYNTISYENSYVMSNRTVTIPMLVLTLKGQQVHMSVAGLPKGVTATFSNYNLTDGHVTMTVNASDSARSGTYLITVIANNNINIHTITLHITV